MHKGRCQTFVLAPIKALSHMPVTALRLGHVRLIVRGQVYDGRMTIYTVFYTAIHLSFIVYFSKYNIAKSITFPSVWVVWKCSWASLLCITPQKGITISVFLTYQAFKNREGIVTQINLAEWFNIGTYEWKQTKIWMIFKLKSWGVLILKCVALFYFNHNLVICF